MKEYLRWSLRQIYLLFFVPTQFRREIEIGDFSQQKIRSGERIGYLMKMLPWIFTLAVLGTFIFGSACAVYSVGFDRRNALLGVAVGVAGGMVLGFMAGVLVRGARAVAATVALCMVSGVAGGLLFGMVGDIEGSIAVRIASLSVLVGSVAGIVFGFVFSVTLDLNEDSARGVLAGVVGGMVVGMSSDSMSHWEVALFFTIGLAIRVVARVRHRSAARASGVANRRLNPMPLGVLVGLYGSAFFGLGMGVASGVAFPIAFGLIYFRLLTFPFYLVLTAVTYCVGRLRQRAAVRAWRCCPVVWNELIWLPMPLAGKLLAILAKQDREEFFKQVTFIVAERTLQRRVALTAKIEVALDDLQVDSMVEIANVTNRINWTREALGDGLPLQLAKTLTVLDQVAQHVGQHLTLQNTYRKSEALKRAVDEMEAIQFHLIANSNRLTKHLLRRANYWRVLIAERESLTKLTNVALEIPNPFIFGNPVLETKHNLFSGRKDIVKQIEASVLGTRQAPTLLLHGPRRIGKTSLLCQLPRLIGSDFAPAFVDCQNPAAIGSEVTLLRYLSRALSEGLELRRIHVEPLTMAALELDPFLVFDEWLDAIEQEMPERMRVLLCLDEYERLQTTLKAGWGERFFDALRHIIQHRPRVLLMFTGTHTFQELGPKWTDRFINVRRMRVSFLRPEDVELLLTIPIPEFNMNYAPNALDAVIAATSCQPFLTQAVAFELVQLLNEQQRKVATPEDVEVAVARALISGGEYFANVWNEAGEQGQVILRAVARGEVPPAFHKARAWLMDHDVLNSDGYFAVDMVRRWVKTKSF